MATPALGTWHIHQGFEGSIQVLDETEYALSARNKWEAQLIGYQHIPDELLLDWQWVNLTVPVKQIIGEAGKRVSCEICREEIINQREGIREATVTIQM